MYKRWMMFGPTSGKFWCRLQNGLGTGSVVYAFFEENPLNKGWQHTEELQSLAIDIMVLHRKGLACINAG